MSFHNLVSIALVAALANPLCCCITGFATPVGTSAMEHACCEEPNGANDQQQDTQNHDPSDCLHQTVRDSQINQTADSGDSLLKPSFHVATLPPIFDFENSVEGIVNKQYSLLEKMNLPPGTSFSQIYCVYLL